MVNYIIVDGGRVTTHYSSVIVYMGSRVLADKLNDEQLVSH